ncbi:MAG: hypothetical protein K8U57_35860 [Planctomycetes bacterium]|nr:hypothetical protein [Planctomycetota bacterium]
MRFISVICVRYAVGLEGKADVSTYTAKQVLVDLGFIDGYLHETDHLPRDWCMFETLFDALQRIEEYALEGHLTGCPPTQSSYARFLHDLGFLRGLIWSQPISSAVSEAIGRVIGFATSSDDFPCRLLDGCGDKAEPSELRLSDEQRHTAGETAISGKDAHTAEFAVSIGATHHGVLDHWRKMGAMTRAEVEEELKGATSPLVPADQTSTEPGTQREEARLPEYHAIPRDEYEWKPWQKQKLAEMKLAGKSYEEIEAVIGKNPSQCRGMWAVERKKLDLATPETPASEHDPDPLLPSGWRQSQLDKLVEVRLAGGSNHDASKATGMKPQKCSMMWRWEKKRRGLEVGDVDPEPAGDDDAQAPSDSDVCVVSVKPDVFEMLTATTDDTTPEAAGHAPADRWKPSPIDVAEWPDIQRMLATGRSREAIAGDYDVPVGDLDDFIADRLWETQERHRAKAEVKSPPGEARALSAEVGSAA